MSVKRIPATEARVEVTITMTEKEYEAISHRASWDGKSVEQYLVWVALGGRRTGC